MSGELRLSINISPSIKPLKSHIACTTGLSFCVVSENRLNDFILLHTLLRLLLLPVLQALLMHLKNSNILQQYVLRNLSAAIGTHDHDICFISGLCRLRTIPHNTQLDSQVKVRCSVTTSSEYATLELLDRITLEMDNMNTPISIFLHLSKAFHTLGHQIRITKLEYHGLNELSIKHMESYYQTGNNILKLTIQSLLCQIVLLEYQSTTGIHPDDTTISTTIERVVRSTTFLTICKILNNKLSIVNNWLKVSKLSLNIKKSKYMIFHTKNVRSLINDVMLIFKLKY